MLDKPLPLRTADIERSIGNRFAPVGQFFTVALLLTLTSCASPSVDDLAHSQPAVRTSNEPRESTSIGTTAPVRTATTPFRPASTTSTSRPTARIDGVEYSCVDVGRGRWDCSSPIGIHAYCNGFNAPRNCSTRWYPDDLAVLEIVEFEGRSYACETFGNRCVAYESGPPPVTFLQPDVWCDSFCTYYDPGTWFELTYEFETYFCRDAVGGFQKYDCVNAFSDRPPQTILEPDLHCSGPEFLARCSELWYPSDLDGEMIITYDGQTYLCDSAYGFGATFGDLDCGPYPGGNPALVFTGALKCSETFGSLACDPDEYPSALEGVYFVTIGGSQHICEDTYQGSECWKYFSGSVRNAMIGTPNYYCNRYNECDQYQYP